MHPFFTRSFSVRFDAWRVGAVSLLAFALGPAVAQNVPIKPGLWESSMRIQTGDTPAVDPLDGLVAQLDKMPFEQRKRAEQQLAQQGIFVGPQGARSRLCMTPEMVARMSQPSREGSCQTTPEPLKGTVLRFAHRCAQPPTQGQGELNFPNPEAYSLTLQTVSDITVPATPSQAARTLQVTTRIQSTSQWLGMDCQGLAPPPAK